MNDPGKRYLYPRRVRFELAEGDLTSYRRAADFLNVNAIDVVSVQHEYGIFGGKAGRHVLELLRDLRMPIVTTLHTILEEPNAEQRAVMDELTSLSERLVVMSERGRAILSAVHGVKGDKIDLIPHGIPNLPPSSRSKDKLGVEGRPMLLTLGLLSPDKGIEHVIDALPEVVAHHPDVVYIVLGATHPHIKAEHGEIYRLSLESRARRLGVDANMIFHNRFVSDLELAEFLAAADIYITPYLKLEQITSGTLAYAVGCGKAVISTPYWYASELLAEGRGILVPWRDPKAIATEVIGLLGNEEKRNALSARAAAYGQDMHWPAVAKSYVASFQRAAAERTTRLNTVYRAKSLAKRPAELPDINLEHLHVMTDHTGILQHAAFSVPLYDEGYCLDDNARALLVMALVEDAATEDRAVVRALGSRYMGFVKYAFNKELGRFRNFMSYSRQWLEPCGSEDSHGRALWALGAVVGRSGDPGQQSLAGDLFHSALPAVLRFTSPRSWAFSLLGIDEYLRAYQGESSVQSVLKTLSKRLHMLYQRTSGADWPWFENSLSYSNARLPQALLAAGTWLENDEMKRNGLSSLEWLADVQRSQDGYFAPIGSDGFWVRGERKAAFDQQPVEACSMISACLDAGRISGDPQWAAHARRAFDWFIGHNVLRQPLYEPRTGGCRDGLHPDRVNENQGAESTLSYLMALLEMRAADRALTTASSRVLT
jgi:glycosyltransferase involved in cell wall biosynthesis